MATAVYSRRDLLGLDGLGRDEIVALLDAADRYLPAVRDAASVEPVLTGRIVANLFFEDSTRTRGSFTVAARRLGAYPLDITGAGSSVSKGETLVDTAQVVEAMGVDALIVRAKPSGSAQLIARAVQCPVINAGDGTHEHPTQGLLDALVMRRRLGDMKGRHVALVGDLSNSRVARSNLHCLTTLGAHVTLVGPPVLVSRDLAGIVKGPGRVDISHDLDAVLPEMDAMMMLRVQFERGTDIPPDYREHFALTVERSARLKDEAIILHPGPMNRGLEIDPEVADDPARSVILEQVTAGVAVRMAVLAALLTDGAGPAPA